MEALHTTFVKSSAVYSDCPEAHIPEFAFVGRSNVGKSSLINMLTGHKDLAKTSGKPGKTQLINHFSVSASAKAKAHWYLVDLPGYGYAKVSKKERNKFKGLIYNYLLKRENLFCGFVLIDIRHEAQAIDLEFINWMGSRQVPFAILFTKSDKLKGKAIEKHLDAYKQKLLETWEELPPLFVTSARSGQGREEVLTYIQEIIQQAG